MSHVWNVDHSIAALAKVHFPVTFKRSQPVSQLMLDVNAIFSIFWCQNELILLYSQVFKDYFLKFKQCFFKFNDFQGVFKDLAVFQGVFQAHMHANHVENKDLKVYNQARKTRSACLRLSWAIAKCHLQLQTNL